MAAYIALANQGPVLQPFLYDKAMSLFNIIYVCECTHMWCILQFLLGPVAVSWIFFIEASSFSISNLFAGLISNKLVNNFGRGEITI